MPSTLLCMFYSQCGKDNIMFSSTGMMIDPTELVGSRLRESRVLSSRCMPQFQIPLAVEPQGSPLLKNEEEFTRSRKERRSQGALIKEASGMFWEGQHGAGEYTAHTGVLEVEF